jgi:ACR3 family arsenite efflux pump ArsB
MNKLKRILALIGAILLFGMYLTVFYLGLTASPDTVNVLMAAIACTIIIPCLLYAMMLIARVLGHGSQSTETDHDKDTAGQKGRKKHEN